MRRRDFILSGYRNSEIHKRPERIQSRGVSKESDSHAQ